MKLSNRLQALASYLAAEDNDFLAEAEGSDEVLRAVATALTIASDALMETSQYVAEREPEESLFSADQLDEMAAVAGAFSESDDELLQKQAAVLDDILLTIGANPGLSVAYKRAEEDRIDQLKLKYQGTKEKLDRQNGVKEILETIKESGVVDRAEIRDMPLSTRYCESHPGVSLQRIAENEYQCPLDKQTISFEGGYTTLKGTKVPGTSVANQSQVGRDTLPDQRMIFDTRSDKMGTK